MHGYTRGGMMFITSVECAFDVYDWRVSCVARCVGDVMCRQGLARLAAAEKLLQLLEGCLIVSNYAICAPVQ